MRLRPWLILTAVVVVIVVAGAVTAADNLAEGLAVAAVAIAAWAHGAGTAYGGPQL